jgi:hypothetical protein
MIGWEDYPWSRQMGLRVKKRPLSEKLGIFLTIVPDRHVYIDKNDALKSAFALAIGDSNVIYASLSSTIMFTWMARVDSMSSRDGPACSAGHLCS